MTVACFVWLLVAALIECLIPDDADVARLGTLRRFALLLSWPLVFVALGLFAVAIGWAALCVAGSGIDMDRWRRS